MAAVLELQQQLQEPTCPWCTCRFATLRFHVDLDVAGFVDFFGECWDSDRIMDISLRNCRSSFRTWKVSSVRMRTCHCQHWETLCNFAAAWSPMLHDSCCSTPLQIRRIVIVHVSFSFIFDVLAFLSPSIIITHCCHHHQKLSFYIVYMHLFLCVLECDIQVNMVPWAKFYHKLYKNTSFSPRSPSKRASRLQGPVERAARPFRPRLCLGALPWAWHHVQCTPSELGGLEIAVWSYVI